MAPLVCTFNSSCPWQVKVNHRLSVIPCPSFWTILHETRAGTTLTRHSERKKKSRGKVCCWIMRQKRGPEKTESGEGLEKLAKSPRLKTCNHCAAIKKRKKKPEITWLALRTFFPSLPVSLLPPFSPTSRGRFTWDVNYGSVSPARLPVS